MIIGFEETLERWEDYSKDARRLGMRLAPQDQRKLNNLRLWHGNAYRKGVLSWQK